MTKSSHAFGENEKVLQAVVLADSFNERFMPITLDRPRCLLPLVNVPIIEYTFEFLAISGVQEVILFCRAHADQIRQYIGKSRWSKATSTMHIQLVINTECMSMGEALRDIDARSMIHGDFILVCGDVVSNVDLTDALTAHKQRCQANRNYIMTMVLKETSPYHRSRERCEGGVFAIDEATGECLAYEPVDTEANLKAITLPLMKLSRPGAPKEISLRFDLMDCQIDICSVNVLALYTENFDYQDVRRDFLRGILTSDILGVKVATHIVQREYASRVRSPHLYDSISKDIVERWTFPLVPETDLLEEQQYSCRRGNVYLGRDVVISRSARIGTNVVLGAGVGVGEGTVIKNSVIGARCQIGSDCVIENSYIWEHSYVENGSRIISSILADHVRVKQHTVVNSGCLVTSNITLGPRAHIPKQTRVAKLGEHIDLAMRQLGLGEDIESFTAKQAFLGEGSDGVVWEGSIDGEFLGGTGEEYFEGEEEVLREERRAAFELGGDFHQSRPIFRDEFEEEDEDYDRNGFNIHDYNEHVNSNAGYDEDDDSDDANAMFSSAGLRTEEGGSTYGRNVAKFMHDGLDLMRHAIETNYAIDNAILELNSLKFSCNASFSECRRVIVRALIEAIAPVSQQDADKLLGRWSVLLCRFTHGSEEQVDLIDAVQAACQEQIDKGINCLSPKAFQNVNTILYKNDVLEEEAILRWYEKHVHEGTVYVRQLKGFVLWLQQSDDDEEEEEEEE